MDTTLATEYGRTVPLRPGLTVELLLDTGQLPVGLRQRHRIRLGPRLGAVDPLDRLVEHRFKDPHPLLAIIPGRFVGGRRYLGGRDEGDESRQTLPSDDCGHRAAGFIARPNPAAGGASETGKGRKRCCQIICDHCGQPVNATVGRCRHLESLRALTSSRGLLRAPLQGSGSCHWASLIRCGGSLTRCDR